VRPQSQDRKGSLKNISPQMNTDEGPMNKDLYLSLCPYLRPSA